MSGEMKRRRPSARGLRQAYDRAYGYVALLRGHSRRDLGAEYLEDLIQQGISGAELKAMSDGISDAIEDGES